MSTGVDSIVAGSPLTREDVEGIRRVLPAVHTRTYLNTGTLGPMPHAAIEAIETERAYDVTQRQTDDLWQRIVAHQAAARTALTRLIGVSDDQVALMHSTHEGINTCVWGLNLSSGDDVVTTDQEHPAALMPLRHARDRTGCRIRIAPWDASSDERFVDNVLRECTPTTRAVLVSHVSWLTGEIAPLRALREALPASVRIIVDGAQSAGVLATNLEDGWDAYTVSGQKWPCGPNGSGGLALRDPEAWLPTFGDVPHASDMSDPLGAPLVATGTRFETSQTAMVPLAGFAAAVNWLVDDVQTWRAAAHARALNVYARTQAAAVLGDRVEQLRGTAHLLTMDLRDTDMQAVSRGVYERGISIPVVHARIRLSLGAWTTPEEIDVALAALASSYDDRMG